jgi:AraC-like DNA-binding protein
LLLQDEGEAVARAVTEFVLHARLARAHRMLIDRRLINLKISAVASEAGFGDISYFNQAFRRRYDAAPSDVRARGLAILLPEPSHQR